MGKRIYPLNEDYFKVWSDEMAYIVGFFMADCTISKRPTKGKRQQIIRLELKNTDIEVVEFVRNQISPTKPIYMSSRKDKRTNNYYYSAIIMFHSNIMADDLTKLGVIPQRTGNEEFKNIPTEYQKHFLRGLTDGDSSIQCNANKRFCLESASISFLESIKSNLGNNLGKVYKRNDCNCNTWEVTRLSDLNYLYHYLYDDGGFCLKRKKDNFEKVVEHYKASRVYKPEVGVLAH